jgi:hypothetical protein
MLFILLPLDLSTSIKVKRKLASIKNIKPIKMPIEIFILLRPEINIRAIEDKIPSKMSEFDAPK